MLPLMPSLREDFLRFVSQTSPAPMGIEVAHSRGSFITDTRGEVYLDLLSGIGVSSIGHTHPSVVTAVQAQAENYLHTMVYGEYVQKPQVLLAKRLADLAPDELSMTYFTNSGTEAVEGALKTARKHTNRSRFVAFNGSFHGDTFGSMSVGGNPLYRDPFEPLLPADLLPFNDLTVLNKIDEDVAAVIVEPIQGEGGIRIPDDDFLPALRERCSKVGALLLFDEVITGFGRTGSFFALEHWNTTPDILILAKALGGGMPLGAFIGAPAVMRTLAYDPALAHVTTFGGHPVSCAAGLASLDVLLSEGLVEQAKKTGDTFLSLLEKMFRKRHCLDVRGRGLLIGIEFDSPQVTQRFVHECFSQKLILGWTLHEDRIVRLAPPLNISEEEISQAVTIMQNVLAGL